MGESLPPFPLLLLDFLLGLGRDLHLGAQLLGDAVEGCQVALEGRQAPGGRVIQGGKIWLENHPEMGIQWGFIGINHGLKAIQW